MIRVLSVFGTRPEAIKMAPVCLALKKARDFRSVVAVTAQHRAMLDQVMDLFRIHSDYDLNIMQENQTLEHIVTQVLGRIGPILQRERPDLVLVHGDTTTTFAAALSAFYHRIPVGHVEAGLRSYDYANPYPEESNRVLADHLCSLHFAPTHQAKKNLLKENIPTRGIFVTGNTVIDALHLAAKMPSSANVSVGDPWIPRQQLRGMTTKSRLILVTAHRRENHGKPLENVFRALRRIVEDFEDVSIIYPVHLNPHVQKPARKILSNHPRIQLTPPVNYLDLVRLMKRSYLVVTDSGGIQEEAPALGKPVLVLRRVTERPEAVKAGTARVVGVEEQTVYQRIRELLTQKKVYDRMANAVNPYGDGRAVPRILDAIRYHLGGRSRRPQEFRGDLT